jgi:hypothetical protein
LTRAVTSISCLAALVIALLRSERHLRRGCLVGVECDYGAISHAGLKSLGPASTGLKLSLELGVIADQQGIANAVKAASDPRRRATATT